jgi:hypothetical protein
MLALKKPAKNREFTGLIINLVTQFFNLAPQLFSIVQTVENLTLQFILDGFYNNKLCILKN